MDKTQIKEVTNTPAIDIALDTIAMNKQALVFCNTRASSEAAAEKIAEEAKLNSPELIVLSEEILKVLQTPTKQCKRLAFCVKNGTAFHHAGLASAQRKLVENNFKKGIIKVISATPTLAMGINLPAFRAIIKDLKRYGGRWGMEYIPTLEYHQMAGRAGRPDFNDTFGEAICIAATEKDAEVILDKYINAPPEKIQSKLAAEPALRTYCLSLIATGFARSKKELMEFFEKTFYAKQYGDLARIKIIIDRILGYLEEWEFIRVEGEKKNDGFVSADKMNDESLAATKLGERVAELYLDPYTAYYIITALRKGMQKTTSEISFLQLAASTLELRPLPTVRVKEAEHIEGAIQEVLSDLITPECSFYDPEFEEYLKSMKLTIALNDWMEEKNEENILESYNISPGEIHFKKELVDWILYASEELAKIFAYNDLIKIIRKTRFRLDKGIKEELVPLARIKNIGRVRARLLFRNGIKDVGDVKAADLVKLIQLLGKQTAFKLKEDVGEAASEAVPAGKRKGQMGIEKYE
jgi:helicase